MTQTATQRGSGRTRLLLVLVGIAAAVVGVGYWMGRSEQAAQSPCQRYAETLDRALDNCHSGQNRSPEKMVASCERDVDPSAACLEAIEKLPCPDLERGAAVSAGAVCLKKR